MIKVIACIENSTLHKLISFAMYLTYYLDKLVLRKIPKWSPYRCSLIPGMWEKNVLLNLIKENETPWEFEKKGSIRSVKYKKWYRVENTIYGTNRFIWHK